jgi:hypothetical protein
MRVSQYNNVKDEKTKLYYESVFDHLHHSLNSAWNSTDSSVHSGGGTMTLPVRPLIPMRGRTKRVMQRSAAEMLTRKGVHGL